MAALNQLDLIVDVSGGRLLNAFTSRKAAPVPKFIFGDSVPVTCRLVKPSPGADPELPWTELTLTSLNAVVSIGALASNPTAGTWSATYDSNTTINLAYNATAANVQTELNALTTITNDGGVTVVKSAEGLYRITWDSNGARNIITVATDTLYPTSSAQVLESVTGSASQREVQTVHLRVSPAVTSTLSTALPSAAATITTLRQGNSTTTTSELQKIDLSNPQPYGGTWSATIPDGATTNSTGALAHDISAAALQTAIIATNSTALTSKVTVAGAFPEWTVEFDQTLNNVAAITADVSNLDVPTGFSGTLDTNTAAFLEQLAGRSSFTGTLEVEISNAASGTSWTPLTTDAVLSDQLAT